MNIYNKNQTKQNYIQFPNQKQKRAQLASEEI